jgi:ABC-type sugar transport system ATPase subunit/ribose/xylose/arabinose/galactoside ABC-type transport system permease subunit
MQPVEQQDETGPAPALADAVVVRHVSKAFAGVQALADVSLELRSGEIHALCGENGAGKSTLIKVLAGVYEADAGTVEAWGVPLRAGSIRAAEAAGISVIFQESVAFPDLDAVDNLFVGREQSCGGGLLLDRRRMVAETRRALATLGVEIDLRQPVSELSLAQRQLVAMARALSHDCRLLILDEPTASLSERESEVLFGLLRRLRDRGVGVLYVSHRLEEVFELADRITVLRDGRRVSTQAVAELDRTGLVRLMVGRELDAAGSRPGPAGATTPRLEVTGLTRRGAFADVSLAVRGGEIVGLAGLVGAGRTEVARCLMGLDCADAGQVVLDGTVLPAGDVRAAIRRGLALVAEDRQHEGLVLAESVRENLVMVACRALSPSWLRRRASERGLAARLVAQLGVRTPGLEVAAEALSGGNQQKLALGKWLGTAPRVLILDEPTRGVDVGAKAEIHRLILDLAREGTAVLLISSELPEVLALSDRILVLRGGRLAGELPGATATQEAVLHLALPGAAVAAADSVPNAAEPAAPRASSARARERRPPAARHVRPSALAVLLALVVAGVSLANPAFLTPGNLRDLLVNAAPVLLVACGMMLVMVTGEIDISVGSLLGLLGALLGYLSSPVRLGWPVALTVPVVLLAGAGVGVLNGVLVALAGVPSIIVTLGMLTILRAATEWLMAGQWITDLPPGLRYFGTGLWAGVPICVVCAAAAVAATLLLSRRTALGRRVYAVGSNPHAAALHGLSVVQVKLTVFALTGLLTGLAAVVSVPQLSVVEAGSGRGFELLVVTGVVVGGVSVRGGVGTVAGVVAGTLLLSIVRTVLVFLPLGQTATYWERTVQGALILVAVLADHLASGRRADSAP